MQLYSHRLIPFFMHIVLMTFLLYTALYVIMLLENILNLHIVTYNFYSIFLLWSGCFAGWRFARI